MNPDELADLEEQRSFLVRSLDDLDRELAAGDLDDLDATTLRDDYTHRLAEVQRAIESGHAAEQATPRRRGRAVVVVAVVAVLAVGAGIAVANAAGSRKPGETVTGNIRQSSADQLNQAAALAQKGSYLAALKLYDTILRTDPKNLEALSERGLLLAQVSQAVNRPELAKDGETSVRAALALDPRNPRALFYLGLLLQLQGDKAGARKAFDDALAANPPASLKTSIQQFRASIGN